MSSNVPMIRDEAMMPTTLEGLMAQAAMLVQSGILPKDIKKPETAAAIIMTGRELGIPPMQAFRVIYVVNGKPTISTEHMAAMLLQAGMFYNIDHLDADHCQITFRRPGMEYTHTFTIADATAAGLAGKAIWKSYTKDMLYNRCFSAGARKFAPDVLGKMYTPEELAPDDVTWDAEAQTVVVTKPEPPAQTDQEKRDNAPPADSTRRSTKPANGDSDVDVGWNAWPDAAHRRFWANAGELNLSDDTLHHEFGVVNMKDWAGTMGDAKAVLDILAYGIKQGVGLKGIREALEVNAVCEWKGHPQLAATHIDNWAARQDTTVQQQGELAG